VNNHEVHREKAQIKAIPTISHSATPTPTTTMCKTTTSITQQSQQLQVTTPDQQTNDVAMPMGAEPGSKFMVDYKPNKNTGLLDSFQRGITYVGKKIERALVVGEEKFNTVHKQCPKCAHICKIHKEHSQQSFFSCPSCAAVINTPGSISKFSYHANKAADHVSGTINRAVGSGQFIFLEITVPKDASPGTALAITAPDGRQLNAQVPAGLSPGQKFQVKVYPPQKVHVAHTNVTVVAPAVSVASVSSVSSSSGQPVVQPSAQTPSSSYTPPAISITSITTTTNPLSAETKWACSRCTFMNQCAGTACEVCAAPRQ
jgi:hypothetical protein